MKCLRCGEKRIYGSAVQYNLGGQGIARKASGYWCRNVKWYSIFHINFVPKGGSELQEVFFKYIGPFLHIIIIGGGFYLMSFIGGR